MEVTTAFVLMFKVKHRCQILGYKFRSLEYRRHCAMWGHFPGKVREALP